MIVTGESPVVDVQTARREIVMQGDVIETLPVARAVGALLNATPGLQVDTNGLALSPTMTFFNANSSTINSTSVAGEGRMTVNGFTVAAARSGGVSSYVYDTPNAEEVTVVVGGGLGESDIGGPVMNLVPRSGGNRFAGDAFLNLAGEWSRGNNLTDELTALNPNLTPDARHHPRPRRQRLVRRSDQARPPLVLRQLSHARHADGDRRHQRQRQRGRRHALGLGRLADRRTPGAGPPDDHRSSDGAARQAPHPVQLRVPASLRGHAAQGGHQGLPQPRRRLDRSRQQRRALPVAGSDVDRRARLLRRAVLPESGVLDDGGEQQAAARGRLHAVPLQPDLRPPGARRHHQPDSGDRAVERDQSGHRPAVSRRWRTTPTAACRAGDGRSARPTAGRRRRRT